MMRTNCGCVSLPKCRARRTLSNSIYRQQKTVMQYRALMEGCQGEICLKDRQIKGLQKELGLIKQTLGT